MMYISQIICVLIAYCMAKHDVTPVDHFSFFGVTTAEQRDFHSSNTFTKFFVVLGFSLLILFNPHAWLFNYFLDAVIAGVVNFLWIWLVFDIVLNINRKRDVKWDYISVNDSTGKHLIKLFGQKAGKIKTLICSVGIIVLNILYLFIK